MSFHIDWNDCNVNCVALKENLIPLNIYNSPTTSLLSFLASLAHIVVLVGYRLEKRLLNTLSHSKATSSYRKLLRWNVLLHVTQWPDLHCESVSMLSPTLFQAAAVQDVFIHYSNMVKPISSPVVRPDEWKLRLTVTVGDCRGPPDTRTEDGRCQNNWKASGFPSPKPECLVASRTTPGQSGSQGRVRVWSWLWMGGLQAYKA